VTARAVLVLVVSAGCAGDPSVSVQFEVPDRYLDLVDTVSLEVLAGDEIDCDAVALGNASEEAQAAARLTEALVHEAGDRVPLSGIPRTGKKLFVARARSESGQLVAGGCAEAGTIDGDVEVAIEGKPALTLGTRDTPSSGPLPAEVTILLSDARGEPVEDAYGGATVYAAAGTEVPVDDTTSSKGGAVRFQVPQPDWAGPQVLDVDVEWQANARDLFAGFKAPFARGGAALPAFAEEEMLPVRTLYRVGRIGPAGEMGVAVLGRVNTDGDRPVHIYLYDPDAGDFSPPSTSAPLPVRAIGVVAGTERDTLVAMDRNLWYVIDADGAVHQALKSGLMNAVELGSLDSCAPGEESELLALGEGGQIAMYDAGGDKLDEWDGGRPTDVRELLATGCVRGLEKTYRAAVYAVDPAVSPRPLLAIDAADTEPAPVNSFTERGLAFTPALASGDGPFLLANRFETDGTSIARYTVVPVDGAPTFLDQRDEDEIAGLAESSAGGDLDGDGLLDVASMVSVPLGDGRVAFRFFVALGRVVEEQRLFGLGATGIDDPDFAPLLLAADFDRDGYDDLFLGTSQAFSLFELEPE